MSLERPSGRLGSLRHHYSRERRSRRQRTETHVEARSSQKEVVSPSPIGVPPSFTASRLPRLQLPQLRKRAALLRDQCVAPRCRRHRTSVVRARALRNVGYFSAKSPCVQFYPWSAGMRTWLSPTCFESCLVPICPSVLFRSTESEYAKQLPPRMSLPCGVCRAVLDK